MKKITDFLGFALLLSIFGILFLAAYRVNFDINGLNQLAQAGWLSLSLPFLDPSTFGPITYLQLAASTLFLIAVFSAAIVFGLKAKVFWLLVSVVSSTAILTLGLIISNGLYLYATDANNLGPIVYVQDVLLRPILDSSSSLQALALTAATAMFSLLYISFHIFSILFIIKNASIHSRKGLHHSPGEIAEELAKFVLPNQLHLSGNDPNSLARESTTTLYSTMNQSLRSPTPMVVLPSGNAQTTYDEVNQARQAFYQLKEKIRKLIRAQLATQPPLFDSSESQAPTLPENVPPPSMFDQVVDGATSTKSQSEGLESISPSVVDTTPAAIQEQVTQAIASEIALLEPKTKEQLANVINEELIKYDSLNREVMESLVSETIESRLSVALDSLKDDVKEILSEQAKEKGPSLQIQDVQDLIHKVIEGSSLSQDLQDLRRRQNELNDRQDQVGISEEQIETIKKSIIEQTLSYEQVKQMIYQTFQSLGDKVDQILKLDPTNFVSKTDLEDHLQPLVQTKQDLIQLHQDLSLIKVTLAQFQLETYARLNPVIDQLNVLESKVKDPLSQSPIMSEATIEEIVKKHQSNLKQDMNLEVVQSLIATEVKKNLPQPMLTKEIVDGWITESIHKQTIHQDQVMQQLSEKEKQFQQLIEDKLSKVQLEISPQQIQDLIKQHMAQLTPHQPHLSVDDVTAMIDTAIYLALNQRPSVKASSYSSSITSSNPSTLTIPTLKKKASRAPENDKRAEQFKSVIPPKEGLTRTGRKKIIRIPFQDRMAKAEPMLLGHYDDLKNYILSYQVKSRISNTGDTFRLHKEEFVKIAIAGKGLKLYLALNPEDYKDGPIPVDDASDKKMYQHIPLVFKVKSELSVKRAKKLVDDLMAKKGLTQKEVPFLPWSKAFQI